MSDKKYFINSDKIAWRNIDGEAVILNLDTGYYYSLNETGTKIREAMNKQKSLVEILNSLKEAYQVPRECLKSDFLELVKDLEKERLIDGIYKINRQIMY